PCNSIQQFGGHMKKRLELKKLTIRDIDESSLNQVAGGASTPADTCAQTCPNTCVVSCAHTTCSGVSCTGPCGGYTSSFGITCGEFTCGPPCPNPSTPQQFC